MPKKDIIFTISGKDAAVDELTRHITMISNICNLKVEVSAQSTLDLKKEIVAIHKQCYMEQKKRTVIMRLIRKVNFDLYNKICAFDDKMFETLYINSPVLPVERKNHD